ncbi:MAG: S-layer protein [Candidatus Methanofastidiosa archaeon]|nr:S-layer protein [Candidatus Methanofastidiosa archaeon]
MKDKKLYIFTLLILIQFSSLYPLLATEVPRSFFVNTTNGQPQSIIVVGKNAASMDLISVNMIITKIESEAYYEDFVYVSITGSKLMEASNNVVFTVDPSMLDLTWTDNKGNSGKFSYGSSIEKINLRFITTDINNLIIFVNSNQNPINIISPELNRNIVVSSEYSLELLDNTPTTQGVYDYGGNIKFNVRFNKQQPGAFQEVKINIWEPQKLITNDQGLMEDAAKNNNIILVGGPVANNIVAGLVQRGISKIDWYNSDGDIEYIPNGLYPGRDVIIVAGSDREKTRNAVVKLINT